MQVVVPLAGPDFELPNGGVRPLEDYKGEPLLRALLKSRSWMQSGEATAADIVFVLRECSALGTFREWLGESYPKAKVVTLSSLTSGALMSALAGLSLSGAQAQPICIDLADIFFKSDFSPTQIFEQDASASGIIPYFSATLPCYSYLELKGNEVLRTVEKRVISEHASAGVYFFRDSRAFLRASNYAQESIYRGEMAFVCPAMNALIRPDSKVLGFPVSEVISCSSKFHC